MYMEEDNEQAVDRQTMHQYVKNQVVDEDEIATEDRSEFGEGWRGPKYKVEIGNFNLNENKNILAA